MILLIVSAFVAPLAFGWVCTNPLLPVSRSSLPGTLLRLALTLGIGLGLSSVLLFLWRTIGAQPGRYFIVTELGLATVTLAISSYRVRKSKITIIKDIPTIQEDGFTTAALTVALALGAMVAIGSVAFLNAIQPHGGWDAWSTWTIRAQFMDGPNWRAALALRNYNPGYPLLLPASISRLWQYTGTSYSCLSSMIIAAVFAGATVLLLCTSLSVLRSRGQGLLAGILLLGTPLFVTQTAAQYADIPFGFCVLATLVLESLFNVCNAPLGLLSIAGVTCGLAWWTKTEGVFFVLAMLIGRFAFPSVQFDSRNVRRQTLFFLIGLIPVMLVLLVFRITVGGSNEMLNGGIHGSIARLGSPSRYLQTGSAFVRAVLPEGFGSWVIDVIPILAFYGLLVGRAQNRNRSLSVPPSLTLVIILAAYFGTYILTPYPLAWHLETSLSRLLLQLWPSMLFALFLWLGTPAENRRHSDECPL